MPPAKNSRKHHRRTPPPLTYAQIAATSPSVAEMPIMPSTTQMKAQDRTPSRVTHRREPTKKLVLKRPSVSPSALPPAKHSGPETSLRSGTSTNGLALPVQEPLWSLNPLNSKDSRRLDEHRIKPANSHALNERMRKLSLEYERPAPPNLEGVNGLGRERHAKGTARSGSPTLEHVRQLHAQGERRKDAWLHERQYARDERASPSQDGSHSLESALRDLSVFQRLSPQWSRNTSYQLPGEETAEATQPRAGESAPASTGPAPVISKARNEEDTSSLASRNSDGEEYEHVEVPEGDRAQTLREVNGTSTRGWRWFGGR
jgi:hypothetical protein